LVLIYTSN